MCKTTVFDNIDYFDILNVKEDGYTNLLKLIFENSKEFKKKFLNLIFKDEIVESKGFVFSTRNTFLTNNDNDKSIKKKIVPDIILYNENYFAMIEVKVGASEGDQQTKDYFSNKDFIKNILGIKNCKSERFYFLTKYGTKPSSDDFDSLSWMDIGNCLPDNTNDELLYNLVLQLKNRINSLNGQPLSSNDLWVPTVKPFFWSGAKKFFDALCMIDELKNMDNRDYWDSFKAAKNTYTYSALFGQKEWKGSKNLAEVDDKSVCDCFEFHLEFEWDVKENKLYSRLDYHLNPYLSKKDISNLSPNLQNLAKRCNKRREEIARSCKELWKKTPNNHYFKCYNGHITGNLMSLVHFDTIIIDENETIDEVLNKIIPMVKIGIDFINNTVLPLIKEDR